MRMPKRSGSGKTVLRPNRNEIFVHVALKSAKAVGVIHSSCRFARNFAKTATRAVVLELETNTLHRYGSSMTRSG